MKKYITCISVIALCLIFYHISHSDYMVYIPNFLSKSEYNRLQHIINKQTKSKYNRNGLITKTLNYQVNDIFYSNDKLNRLSNELGVHVYPSQIPCEYRLYDKSQGMKWHKDIQLYVKPQYECVYTISNNSDSTTDYIDHWGLKHKIWTQPNSLMIVKASGFKHSVNPVSRGKREIVKLIYTPTNELYKRNINQYNMALYGNT